ncbi:ATP-binding protein [Psychrosphaera sp.]|nr:ATP-binding protein [Psychrosphaera sp.]
MKLDKLWISEFKNLKDIEIDFDQDELVTVVIGWNGAGKSNVIEALVIIFRDLDLHKAPSFSYKLEYICRGNRIIVETTDTKIKKEQYKVLIHEEGNTEKVITDKYTDFFNNEDRAYLPSNVFGYYSGPSDRLATHFYEHQRKFREQLLYPEKHGLDEKTLPLRPLFYAQKVHSNFVLLSFFLGADEKVKKFLKEKLFIEDIESVLFVLNKPDWNSKEGDSRFWNATGVVRPFLDRLFSASLAPMRKKIKVPHPMKKNPENVDALFLYLKDLKALQEVGKETSDKDFFKLLESIHFSNLTHDVRIRVKVKDKNGSDESLTFRELSEGEQQLITVLGLLRFTRDDESLFLLDEPDTHLNPAWSMEYINFLKEVAGFNLDAKEDGDDKGEEESDAVDNSHIVLATHDPIVISTLKQEQIQIMKRDEESLKVFAAPPLYEPKGMGFSGILMSDMFGLRSDLDPKTLAKLDEHAILLAKEERTEPEEMRYKQLQEQLDKSGFLDAYSDPYFSAFVKAWGRKHGDKLFTQTFLTDGDRKQLADMTDDILAELDAEEASE